MEVQTKAERDRKEIARHPALDHCLQLFVKVVGEVGFELTLSGSKLSPFPCSEASFPGSQPMLGCQAYDGTLQVSVYLRRGVSLCCPKFLG